LREHRARVLTLEPHWIGFTLRLKLTGTKTMRQRPIVIMVFGILNIGFALFKCAGLLLGALVMNANPGGNPAVAALRNNPTYAEWNHVSMVVTAIFGIMLVASGIGLLLLQNWARVLAMVYAALDILFVGMGAIFTQKVLAPLMASQIHGPSAAIVEMSMKVGFVFGLLFGMAYPILLLIFMTRPQVVEACKPLAVPFENPAG
jgi:hypothetical protein